MSAVSRAQLNGVKDVPRHRLLRWIAGLLLPLVIVGYIAEDVFEKERFAFETPMLGWIHAHSTPVLTQVSLFLHHFGNPTIMGGVFLALPLGLWLARRQTQATFALFGLGSAVAITLLMKMLFHRARPELWPRLVTENGASFPSGHSKVAAALATCLILLLWRTPLKWPALVLGVSYALLSGYARLVLGVHYPTDVLVGWLVGMGCVLGAYDLTVSRKKRE